MSSGWTRALRPSRTSPQHSRVERPSRYGRCYAFADRLVDRARAVRATKIILRVVPRELRPRRPNRSPLRYVPRRDRRANVRSRRVPYHATTLPGRPESPPRVASNLEHALASSPRLKATIDRTRPPRRTVRYFVFWPVGERRSRSKDAHDILHDRPEIASRTVCGEFSHTNRYRRNATFVRFSGPTYVELLPASNEVLLTLERTERSRLARGT